MTAEGTSPAPTTSGRPAWVNKAIVVAVAAVALVIAYLILSAFLPRWWSIRVANLSDQSFTKGIAWGLAFGVVCTFLSLAFFTAAFAVRKRRGGKITAIVALILAVVAAIPNLLTLTIVLGSNNAAHAGERTLDTEAPGFRGATALGAVIAFAAFALLAFVIVRSRRRRAAVRRGAATAQTPPSA
ncbi:MAG: permease [Rhodococcus sp. (in: high G+C Gram-positive bacteria)]